MTVAPCRLVVDDVKTTDRNALIARIPIKLLSADQDGIVFDLDEHIPTGFEVSRDIRKQVAPTVADRVTAEQSVRTEDRQSEQD
jgi:hypothetical protein